MGWILGGLLVATVPAPARAESGRIDAVPKSFGLTAFKSDLQSGGNLDRLGGGIILEAPYGFSPYVVLNMGLELGVIRDQHATYDYTPSGGARLMVNDVDAREFFGRLRPSLRFILFPEKSPFRIFVGAGLAFELSLLLQSDSGVQSAIAAQASPSSYSQTDTLNSSYYFGEAGVEFGGDSMAVRLQGSRDLPILSSGAATLGGQKITAQNTRVALTLVLRR